MSGSTIGGVVGGAIGFYFGGPQGAQVGWMIGSAVGGYIDPEQVKQFGPRLTDAMTQTARDGLPIPFGYGTFPCAGNIIWTTGVTEVPHVEKSDGKGSGVETTTTTYSYHRSYAIGVCEGPVGKFLVIKRNGVPVYDTRSDAQLTALGYTSAQISSVRSATSAFLQKATLYLGSETQLPDSTIEAVEGAGNVSAFRGLAYIVVENDDLTDFRGAIPQYEFVVATCGSVTSSYVEPGAWVAEATTNSQVHLVGPTEGEQDAFPTTGEQGFGIAMAPDSRSVWVITGNSGTEVYAVDQISTADGSLISSFDLEVASPRAIVASPDGEYLYIGHGAGNCVIKYGTDGGGEVDRTADLGADPYALAIAADGSEVYAGVAGVKRIDTSDMSVTATIASSEGTVAGLALSPADADKLYATVSAESGFLAIDLSDGSYAVKSGPTSPSGVCFSTDGAKAYFCVPGSVAVVTAATDTWTHNIDVGATFEAIATNLNGDRLFVGTSTFGADLREVDIATETVTEAYSGIQTYSRRGIAARPLP